jgi:hypothetical protein
MSATRGAVDDVGFHRHQFSGSSDLFSHYREMAVEQEIEKEIARLADETDELGKLVGIHEQAEDAREASSSAYGLRKICFSVSDIEIRKQLIAKHREAARLNIKWLRQNVAVAKVSGDENDLKGLKNC